MTTDPNGLLALANCYACYGSNPYALSLMELSLMVDWANKPPPAPVLSENGARNQAAWTWGGTNPDHWRLVASASPAMTNTTFYTPLANLTGPVRSISWNQLFSKPYGQIWGEDASNNIITSKSNVVHFV